MGIRYRSLGGGKRAWEVDTWSEWYSSFPTSKVSEGDTLYYVEGQVSLTRRGGRWRPDEPHFWGRNDASAVPFGSIDSEGIWTVTPVASPYHTTIGTAYANKFIDVLGIIVATGAEFFALNTADRVDYGIGVLTGNRYEPPRFLGIRGVYFEKAGTGTFTIGSTETNFADDGTGGEGMNGAPAQTAVGDGMNAYCYVPGMIAAGGRGGTSSATETGGNCYNSPAERYEAEDGYSHNILAWGSFGAGDYTVTS